jgi:hypothetical protein
MRTKARIAREGMMRNTRGKHANKDGFLPLGHLCGGLEVTSGKKLRDDGKKNNRWGYDCLCRYCLRVKWVSYASLSGGCAKSCGCMTNTWLTESGCRGKGKVRKTNPLAGEQAFVDKWTR